MFYGCEAGRLEPEPLSFGEESPVELRARKLMARKMLPGNDSNRESSEISASRGKRGKRTARPLRDIAAWNSACTLPGNILGALRVMLVIKRVDIRD